MVHPSSRAYGGGNTTAIDYPGEDSSSSDSDYYYGGMHMCDICAYCVPRRKVSASKDDVDLFLMQSCLIGSFYLLFYD
jgi:hypothetical protein